VASIALSPGGASAARARAGVREALQAQQLHPITPGPGAHGRSTGAPAAGLWEPRDYSDETARRIDAAIQRLLTEAHQGTRALLAENRATLDAIAAALLREEALDREDLAALVSSRDAPVWERGPVTSAPRRGGQRRRCAVCGGSGCVAGVTLM